MPEDKKTEETFPQIIKDHTNLPVNPNIVMFIDTATRYSGYAFFERTKIKPTTWMLIAYGVIKATNKKDWQPRCLEMSAKISNIFHSVKPGHLVIEYPHFQGGSGKGQHAARAGHTLQLAYLCGRISMAWEYYITKVGLDTGSIPPLARLLEYREWNGQLRKKHTCQRLYEFFGIKADPDSSDNDYADAIMMGRWYLNKYGKGKIVGVHQAERTDL